MDPTTDKRSNILWKLQNIDRRILYLLLLVVVAIPVLWPVTMPNAVDPMSESLWKTVDATPPDKIILLSSTWSKATRGENGGQTRALLEHMMSRRIRFALSSFTAPGAQVILDIVREMAPRFDYVYGRDWVHLGFQASANNFVKGINADFRKTVRQDFVEKRPLDAFAVMEGVRSIDDVHMVIEISAAATHMVWMQFIKPGVLVGFCPTSVMAPESLPYYSSRQLAGVLWGAKGAYDYEQLNVRNGTGTYGMGRQYMAPLSAAFALVILSITIGNVAMFLSRPGIGRGGTAS